MFFGKIKYAQQYIQGYKFVIEPAVARGSFPRRGIELRACNKPPPVCRGCDYSQGSPATLPVLYSHQLASETSLLPSLLTLSSTLNAPLPLILTLYLYLFYLSILLLLAHTLTHIYIYIYIPPIYISIYTAIRAQSFSP